MDCGAMFKLGRGQKGRGLNWMPFETLFTKYNELIQAIVGGAGGLAGSYFALMAIKNGFDYGSSDDPQKKSQAKDGFKRMGIGAGVVGMATYIGTQLISHF